MGGYHQYNWSRTPEVEICGESWTKTQSGRAHDVDNDKILHLTLVSPSSGTFSTNFNPPLPQQGSDEWLNRGNDVKCNGYTKKLWKGLHFITLVSGGSIRRIYNQLKTETISIYALRQMFSKTGDDLWFARGANTLLLNNIRTPRTNRQVVETLQLYNKKHEHK